MPSRPTRPAASPPATYSRPAPSDADFAALEELARTLTDSGHYRVVRRFRRRERYAEPDGAETKTALFVDAETTGLGSTARIIELAAVPFTYCPRTGTVFDVGTPVSFLEDPGEPIPAEVTTLTGITDEMVAGRRIDDHEVHAVASDADLVIAHNAAFDRPLLEARLPVFRDKPWACSRDDVPWREHGCTSTKLEFILYQSCGEFFDGHRALEDCLVGIHALATPTCAGARPMSLLLEAARRPTSRIWACEAPYDAKDALRGRGYRWNDGTDGRPKAWYRDVPAPDEKEECAWLEETVYGRARPPYRVVRVKATERYSGRV
jgi:DNA polymerase-3 subunit epsilon